MQLPGGPQDPGETEPVLKRQRGWPPCLGRLPGMTGPRGLVRLGPGLSKSKAEGQIDLSIQKEARQPRSPSTARCLLSAFHVHLLKAVAALLIATHCSQGLIWLKLP